MNDTPKRIWAWYDAEYGVVTGSLTNNPYQPSKEYVLKDITDELVEALKVCWDELDEPTGNMGRIEAVNKARNALSKYQETPMQKLQRLGQEFDNAPETET